MEDCLFLFRYRIVAMRSPWMTSCNSFCSEPDASNNAPFLNCLYRVLRTRWRVPAMRTKQRREGKLVDADRKYKDFF
jgi:hypothetical protein